LHLIGRFVADFSTVAARRADFPSKSVARMAAEGAPRVILRRAAQIVPAGEA
jgi:hypothetical protein